MLYNRHIIDHDMVYSIDFLQIDSGLACLADDVVTLLFGSLDFEKIRHFGMLDCDSGIKHDSRSEAESWQNRCRTTD